MCRMCKRCLVPSQTFEAKFSCKYSNIDRLVVCKLGEPIFRSLQWLDPFEREFVLDYIMGEFGDEYFSSSITQMSAIDTQKVNKFVEGVSNDYHLFANSIELLSATRPVRMKAISQLEAAFQQSVMAMKAQRKSALSSLHTRQSLEMDMQSSNSGEVEGMVHQHMAEIDELVQFWNSKLHELTSVQMNEYKALVNDVLEEKANPDERNGHTKSYKFKRLEISGFEWRGFEPVAAAQFCTHFPARLIRLITLKGDFFSVIHPMKYVDSFADPEEEVVLHDELESAVVIGRRDYGQSANNQDCALERLFDEAPVDCRWPSYSEQIHNIHQQDSSDTNIHITRHSNLSHGIRLIFHVRPCEDMSSHISRIFSFADANGIKRVYVPLEIVSDWLSPTNIFTDDRQMKQMLKTQIRKLGNCFTNSTLEEIVLIRN